MKKVMSIISIIAGGLIIFVEFAPALIGFFAQKAVNTVSMIGGSDGPTAVFVTGVVGKSGMIEIILGIFLIAAGYSLISLK